MYQPSTAFVENKGWLEAALWTKTLVAGGARGVALKSKLPFIAAWEERLGYVREERSRLRVKTDWGMRCSHSWDVKSESQEASSVQR